MSQSIAELERRLSGLADDLLAFLTDLAAFRQTSPQARAESAKLLERYMIEVSRAVKQLGKDYHDDLLEGVSLLKIKMMS